jgi:hypothetical protein
VPQRAEDAERQAVDVEQRQPVDQVVVGGPVPGGGARRERTAPFGGPVVPLV